MHHLILGNGIAGISAALRLRQRDPSARISVVSGESTHHYSRPALMYVFMGHMRYQDTKPYGDGFWAERRIELVRDWVTRIDLAAKRAERRAGAPIAYDRLLFATGSRTNRFGWPGQDLAGVQGLYGLQDLVALEQNVKGARHAVLVGGGLIGIELAEMLHSRGIHVTFLVREKSYWNRILPAEESAMVTRVIRALGIDLRLGVELREIHDDGRGRAGAITTSAGERIECQIVGLTAGVAPNVDVAKASGLRCGRGVLVDWTLAASDPNVFAAGDCAEIEKSATRPGLLQQVWYTGKMQGEVAADGMLGAPREYQPGIWYNSAKFVDLEYQVYGEVNLSIPGERSLYWEHPSGLKSLRVVYTDAQVIGFNFMGMRGRHRVCEAWIREKKPVREVLARLSECDFDPEFFRRDYAAMARALSQQLQPSKVSA